MSLPRPAHYFCWPQLQSCPQILAVNQNICRQTFVSKYPAFIGPQALTFIRPTREKREENSFVFNLSERKRKSLRAIIVRLSFLSICGVLPYIGVHIQLSNRKIFAILCLRFWDFLAVFPGPRSALSVRLTVPIVLLSVCLQRFMCLTELLLGVYYWQQ